MNWFKLILRALATSLTTRVLAMGLRFVTICLLPIWLVPAEIGFNAVLMAILNFSIAIIDLGFGTALIKEKTCTIAMYRSVLTLILAFSLLGSGSLIFFSASIGAFFSIPPILLILSAFAIPFSVLTIVPNALLQRDLRFTNLALRDLFGEVAFCATALFLAIDGATELCVAIALVAQRIVRWLISSLSIRYSPGLAFHWGEIQKLLRFSLFQLGNLTVTQLANRLDTLLLSIFLTPTMVGFYSQGQQLSTIPVQSVTGTVTNIFFATFAKLQDEVEKFKALFIRIVRGMLFLSLLAVSIAYPAMGLIPRIYGADWAASVEIARTLCFSLPFFVMSCLEGILITVGGERRRLASSLMRMGIMALGISLCFTVFSATANACDVARIVFISAFVGTMLNFQYLWKKLDMTAKDARAWLKPLLGGAILTALSLTLTHLFAL